MSATIKLSSTATKEFWEIPILFQDEHVLVLDKPAKLLVSPDRDAPDRPNLMNLLHVGIATGKPWSRTHNLTYLAAAHRLDAETTGVLLLAKSKAVLITLANLFGSEQPVRTQLALVHGTMDKPYESDGKLAPHPVKPGQFHTDSRRGKKSRTTFEPLEKFQNCTLVRCRLSTDRPHQARVHLSQLGWPVVADELYGGKNLWLSRLKKDFRLKPGHEERPLISSAAIHAEELTLDHPVTNQPLTVTAPWPKDLKVAVKYLRLYSAA